MAETLSGFWGHILRDAPQDMLTVVAVGVGLAAMAIVVLRLVGTRPHKNTRTTDRNPALGSETPPTWYE